jgi:hypothetical protein
VYVVLRLKEAKTRTDSVLLEVIVEYSLYREEETNR